VVFRVDGFSPPREISFDCTTCGKETTWFRVYDPSSLGLGQTRTGGAVPDWSLNSVAYTCFRCKKASLTVIYREMEFERRLEAMPSAGVPGVPPPPTQVRVLTGVMKVGQYPELTVGIPKGLANNLGKNAADLYRKALICRNHGFGLAAAGYMRRVVEDKTNELIEIAAKHAEAQGVPAETVAKMGEAADSTKHTTYETKLQFAATVFPDSLKVGSINPLQVLYRLVSRGLHGLSEEECIEIADEIKTVFEYVFEKLSAQIADRRAFMEKIKKLS
jgi:hypothetical protein